jgi:uncharacterized BrkB/YihY/UPF0761 family membrane protein
MKLGGAAAVLFAIWKFAPNKEVQIGAVAVGAVIAAKMLPIPFVQPALTA